MLAEGLSFLTLSSLALAKTNPRLKETL